MHRFSFWRKRIILENVVCFFLFREIIFDSKISWSLYYYECRCTNATIIVKCSSCDKRVTDTKLNISLFCLTFFYSFGSFWLCNTATQLFTSSDKHVNSETKTSKKLPLHVMIQSQSNDYFYTCTYAHGKISNIWQVIAYRSLHDH